MTPTEFNRELERLCLVLPNFAKACQLLPETNPMIREEDRNAVPRFWFSKLEPFSVESFRSGYEQAALQPKEFPDFADVLEFTRQAEARKIPSPKQALYLPPSAQNDSLKRDTFFTQVKPNDVLDLVEDEIDRQIRVLTQFGFTIVAVNRVESKYDHDLKNLFDKELQLGTKIYSATISFFGTSQTDFKGFSAYTKSDWSGVAEEVIAKEKRQSAPPENDKEIEIIINRMLESYAKRTPSPSNSGF